METINTLGAILGACFLPTWKPLSDTELAETAVHSELTANRPLVRDGRCIVSVQSNSILNNIRHFKESHCVLYEVLVDRPIHFMSPNIQTNSTDGPSPVLTTVGFFLRQPGVFVCGA